MAILTLALGIGAVTVIYSVLRNVVLDPFPYSRSDRMVNVLLKDASDRIHRGPYFPAPEFLDYLEQTQAFEDVVGTSRDAMHWVSEAGAERLSIAWMTSNGFAFLGVPPQIGRVFGASMLRPVRRQLRSWHIARGSGSSTPTLASSAARSCSTADHGPSSA